MSPSNFFSRPEVALVADASAVINLNASLIAPAIIRALPHRVVVTDRAWRELEEGEQKGHDDARQLRDLEQEGLIARVPMEHEGTRVYFELIGGSTTQTLDDGEAATIGYASETSSIALIDEAKAKKLCEGHYPQLELICTVQLLLHPLLKERIGGDAQASAIINALQGARMNVPKRLLQSVVELIGIEAAQACPSLPRFART